MSITTAEREDTEERSVRRCEVVLEWPKYMQRSVWTSMDDSSRISPTAFCTVTDDPLPRPPPEEFMNSDAVTTIQNNPHLFQIITPIEVDRFEKLLESHPNQLFVQSICDSLHEGFWPWAITRKGEYPATWDFSDRPPKTECEAGFLRDQRDIELNEMRYSEGFGTDLLPGMYSTPSIHAPLGEAEACQ
jgi:hypothetical protein